MKTILLLSLFVTALFASSELKSDPNVIIEGADVESYLLDINLENFQDTIEYYPNLVIGFYAPWCGACKNWFPKMNDIAKQYDGRFHFGKMNAWNISHIEINTKYGVTGYPTLVFFRDGVGSRYNKSLTTDNFMDMIERKLRPLYWPLTNEEEVDQFLNFWDVSVLGFVENTNNIDVQKFVNKTLLAVHETSNIGLVNATEQLKQRFNVTSVPTFLYHRYFADNYERFNSLQHQQFVDWVDTYKYPLVGEINNDNKNSYVESGVPLCFLYYKNEDERKFLIQIATPIAQATVRKVHFVLIDWNEHGARSVNLGLSGTKSPSIVIEDLKEEVPYPFSENLEITTANVRSFVSDFLSGELFPYLRSQPVAEQDPKDPVITVVGSTFNQLVLDNNKDVFLLSHADWCGHCARVMPIWTQLAEYLKSHSNFVIAKIDGENNDLPPKYGRGGSFPQIKLFRAMDKRTAVDYVLKTRTLESFIKFLQEYATFGGELKNKDEL